MNVKLSKLRLNGKLRILGSKSFAHRLLLASFLSRKECHIDNVPNSKDIEATISCIEAMGGKILKKDKQISVIFTDSVSKNELVTLHCNESGSTLRFLIPIALTMFKNVKVNGTKKLISRGIEEYETIFNKQGIQYKINEDSIEIHGELKPDNFVINGNISSQYITGLLLALPCLGGDSKITILPPINSKNYIDITLSILDEFGIKYQVKENEILIPGNQEYKSGSFETEGDYSNAAFLEAFNYFGSNVDIQGLNPNSLQGDKVYVELFKKLHESNQQIDVSNCIDLCPVLFVFASLNKGATFTGTARLKFKESDRALAIKEELAKVGAKVMVNDDSVVVETLKDIPTSVTFNTHNDHRIAMALSLVSSLCDATLLNAECVNKSYPDYFKDLEKLGGTVCYEE